MGRIQPSARLQGLRGFIMGVKRVLPLKEKERVIGCCDVCPNFYKPRLFGVVPAYCKKEGRILSEIDHNCGQGGPVGVGQDWYVIPNWCPLDEVTP